MNAAPDLATEVRRAADVVLHYLAECDPSPSEAVDAIIGFGVFDLSLPRFCGDLFERGLARSIIFTGGIGAGTGNLGGAEADVWRDELRRSHPTIGDNAVVIENRSTNTAENIQYTAELLERIAPDRALGRGVRSAIIVASPSRLRRVGLTLRLRVPQLATVRMLPCVSFDEQAALYLSHGVPYLPHLVGELDRLATYPGRGWIAAEAIPSAVQAAGEILRRTAGSA